MYSNGDKIILITGANSGIGRASALRLAEMGFAIILVSRNHSRGEKALIELKKKTGNEKIFLMFADLSSQKSVVGLTEEIKLKFDHIDILINNAGAYFSKRHLTVDGIEASFAINYLSRFLLTNLLIDTIKKSGNGRIINVAGEHHRRGILYFEDLNMTANYSGFRAGAQAELSNLLFTYSLGEKLTSSFYGQDVNITINCMHPGAVATNIIYSDPDAGPGIKFLYTICSLFLKSPKRGAETIIYLATSEEVKNMNGKYFINKKAVPSSPASYNKADAEQLWQISENLTSKYLLSR